MAEELATERPQDESLPEGPAVSLPRLGRAPLDLTMQVRAIGSLMAGTRISLGLEIGTSQLKIACLVHRRGKWAVMDGSKATIPPEKRDRPEDRLAFLRETLRAYLARVGVPFLAKVGLSVSGPEVLAATLLVPRGTPAEIRKAIETELTQRLSYPLSEAVWRFVQSPEPIESEEERVAVFAAAAPQRWIQDLVGVCRSLRLVPCWVTVAPGAILRFLQQTDLLSASPILGVLEIGFSSSTALFFNKGSLEYLRTIPIGSGQFIQMLLRSVTATRGERPMTAAEAEQILQAYGVGLTEKPTLIPEMGNVESNAVYALLRPILENLFQEIQRTLYYYPQAYKRLLPERVWVCGGGACIPSIVDFLNANADKTALEPINPLELLKGWEDPWASAQANMQPAAAQFVGAIGAAGPRPLKALQKIPALYQSKVWFAWVQLAGRSLGAVGLIVTLALTVSMRFERLRYERLLRDAAAKVEQLLPKAEKIQEYQRQKAALAEKEALIGKAIPRQPLWLGLLKELSHITPEGIHLIAVETETDAGPLRLRIRGEILPSYTSAEVLYSQYQLALEQSPFFADIQLVTMNKDLYSPFQRATFEIQCRLVY